ncbi:unnamed protein product [Adineta ricciae]|uniref:Uncharacterized protein n=1 Tax=Adineta ricciae TaxID=249248 RepID=A0A814TN84_ADIRI|nr:unnamed protein product [Adineta ricciae]CAF1228320.1 unnamed protein product [Adineta ricciae]
MSVLLSNLRLFPRYSTSIYTSRPNAAIRAASSNINLPRDAARPSQTYWRPAALIVGLVGVVALLRMSRKEEQLIQHARDKDPHQETKTSK